MALHFDGVSNDSRAQSKELFSWGQGEVEDLKDGLSSIFNGESFGAHVTRPMIQFQIDWHISTSFRAP